MPVKIISVILGFAGAVFIAVMLFIGVAQAASQSDPSSVYNHSIYRAGDTVTINGTVNGSVYCAGQSVNINATVNGDIVCAGQTLNINGTVNGSVNVVGQTINIGATVTHSINIAGQDITTNSGSVIKDVSVVGQSITINGKVSRDLSVAGNDVNVNNNVGRNIEADLNKLVLSNGAVVTGKVNYTSPNSIEIKNGAKVVGKITYHKTAPRNTSTAGDFIAFRIYWLVALAVLSMVLAAIFPRFFKAWNPVKGTDFWIRFLTGIVSTFAAPAIVLILFISIIGFPLGLAFAAFWFLVVLMSMPFTSYFIGNLIGKNLHPVLKALIGSVVLGILEAIPFVGWAFIVIAYWIGSGIIALGIKNGYKRLHSI